MGKQTKKNEHLASRKHVEQGKGQLVGEVRGGKGAKRKMKIGSEYVEVMRE